MSQDSIFSRVKAAISGLKADLATVEKSISAEQAELERLRTSPPPLADVQQLLADVVTERAAKGRALLAQSIGFLQRHPLKVAVDRSGIDQRVAILTAHKPDQAPSVQSLELALCALLEGSVQAGLAKIIATIEWPEAGPPLADRQKLIEAAERRLAKATEAREELRRSAAAAGVLI